jgi:general secretion pathway protein K
VTRDRRGFALIAVLLVLALLGSVVTELALSMRLEAAAVRAYKEGIIGAHLAEAGVEQAIREILSDSSIQGLDEDGSLAFYQLAAGQTVPRRLPPMPRTRVPLGPGEFSYRITDEDSRINVNLATPDQIDRLLLALNLDPRVRDTIRDSLTDWRDADDLFLINGAESEDTYLKLPAPYRARNGNLQDVAELLQIKGVTPEIYRSTPEQPGLSGLVTVLGSNNINVNTAPPAVLKAIGVTDAVVSSWVQSRSQVPHRSPPAEGGTAATRRLSVGSQIFRIEAEGWMGGKPVARLLAIVQRSTAVPTASLPGALPSDPVTVLSWRPGGAP